MKQKFIDYFSNVASVTSKLSYAKKLQVGCVIVKDNRILSIGYNGTPAGWDNDCEDIIKWPNGDIKFLTTKPEVLHAEANALMKLCASTESSKDAPAALASLSLNWLISFSKPLALSTKATTLSSAVLLSAFTNAAI